MIDPYRAPVTALDAQLDLLEALDTTGMQVRIRDQIPSAGAEEMLRMLIMSRAALGGWTCWVGGDAVAVITEAAGSLPAPDGQISAGIIPQHSGVMWIAGDALMLDAGPVRGIGWSCQILETPDGSGWAPTVGLVLLLDEPGERLPTPAPGPAMPLSEDAAAMMPGDLPDDLEYVAVPGIADAWDDSQVEALRWVLAAWVMCGQVLPQHVKSVPRPLRRRAHRLIVDMSPDWGEVHVTTLRAAQRGGGYGEWEDAPPSHHHRWVVRGHWRWQACGKGRKDRRLTWIAPYVKGPEDAPLVEVEQVAKLVR